MNKGPGTFAAEALRDVQGMIRSLGKGGAQPDSPVQLVASMIGEPLLIDLVGAIRTSVKYLLPKDGWIWPRSGTADVVPMDSFEPHDPIALVEFTSTESGYSAEKHGTLRAPNRLAVVIDLSDSNVYRVWQKHFRALRVDSVIDPQAGCLVWPIDRCGDVGNTEIDWMPSWVAAFVPYRQVPEVTSGANLPDSVKADLEQFGMTFRRDDLFSKIEWHSVVMFQEAHRKRVLASVVEQVSKNLTARLNREVTEAELADGVEELIWIDVRVEVRVAIELLINLAGGKLQVQSVKGPKPAQDGLPHFEYREIRPI